ncbi:MAG: amino acid permease, partial [Thermoleophilaceae bacterium]|nr:amino acid permease [Thermoleophilaceae bacterium]
MSRPEEPGGGRVRASLRRGSEEAEARIARSLGEPALFAVGLSAAGSSIYFALGVVADGALGLTPVAFLAAGIFFVVTMLTYVEGNSLYPERGGASVFARYAFNELWSFIAGWAILLDYLIVMAIGAFAVSHYLAAFWGDAGDPGVELVIAGATIAYVARANIQGITAERFRFLLRLSVASVVLFAAIIVVGSVQLFDLALLTDSIELWETPEWNDVVFAGVIAAVALTGIEAASGLAGDLRVGRRGLRRVVRVAAAGVLVLFVGISVVALMAVPVVDGSTELGGTLIE